MQRLGWIAAALLTACLALAAASSALAQEPFEFHGLRMGMALAEIEAAGYGLTKGTDTAIAGQGWSVERGLPRGLHALSLYLFNHQLFQIDVTFPPLRGEAALAFILALRKTHGAPAERDFDPLRDERWSRGGQTFHYSPGIRDDGSLAVNLFITDEALYARALEMKERPPEGRGL